MFIWVLLKIVLLQMEAFLYAKEDNNIEILGLTTINMAARYGGVIFIEKK